MIKLDYSLDNVQERLALVNKILTEEPETANLDLLADYLIFCMEKAEKKEKKILTDNRLVTVNQRETSYENLVSKFENGEDGIYNILNENKNVIFKPKIEITEEDKRRVPELAQTTESIAAWNKRAKESTGRDAFIAKTALIQTRKDQYVIKNGALQPIMTTHLVRSTHEIELDGHVTFDENGYCVPHGISLINPLVCSIILCNYSKLKQNSWGRWDDTWSLMEDFDRISKKALEPYPLLYKIVECKIDGLQNVDIQEELEKEFGMSHSLEYLSSLWRKKIPALIASAAEDDYLDWYYLEVERGTYKRCSRCGQIKLAHNKYFSKNKTSKDGWYSICKKCRNAKAGIVQFIEDENCLEVEEGGE